MFLESKKSAKEFIDSLLNESISMSDFKSLERIRDDFYEGKPLEEGGTSIKGKGAAPGVRDLMTMGVFKNGDKIIDYGAGRYARNADFLREQGFTVYAYDPFNGKDVDGYAMGNVSDKLPTEKFDVGFSSFVLNVVPFYIEKEIVKELESICKRPYHITRNKDIFDTISNSLEKENPMVLTYFNTVYKGTNHLDVNEQFDLCCFGVATSRGFQRIPTTETLGYKLEKESSGYKIYSK